MQSPDEDGVLDMTERTWSCRTESSKTLTQVLLRLCNHSARKDHECRVEVTKDSIVFLVTGDGMSTRRRLAATAHTIPIHCRKGQDGGGQSRLRRRSIRRLLLQLRRPQLFRQYEHAAGLPATVRVHLGQHSRHPDLLGNHNPISFPRLDILSYLLCYVYCRTMTRSFGSLWRTAGCSPPATSSP